MPIEDAIPTTLPLRWWMSMNALSANALIEPGLVTRSRLLERFRDVANIPSE
jgi:hypothetical protein